MKNLRKTAFLSATILLVVCCTAKVDKTSNHAREKDLADPELSLSGVPTSAVPSGTSFVLTVSSKSGGDIYVESDNSAFVSVLAKSAKEFQITVASVKDRDVTVSVLQEEDDSYSEATNDFTFQIKGTVTGALPGLDDELSGTVVTYTESKKSPINPERGLYRMFEIKSAYDKISATDVKARRAQGNAVFMLEFYLMDFMKDNISSSYIHNMRDCFNAIREGGAKAIVRFAYTNQWIAGEDEEPPVYIVMNHVKQIKPVLQENEDVIFVMQAGFVGTWGEWTSTTHFEIEDRKNLCDALLEALPSSRQIGLRTAYHKRKMYNLSYKDTVTQATAHDGSLISRIGGHNDCLVSVSEDHGTYKCVEDRDYWMAETRYTIMGGETCELCEWCQCEHYLQELADFHWTYLNAGYHDGVISRWKTGGCYDEIVDNLGYRLVFKDVSYETLEAGKPCKLTIRMENKGYAAPMNPRLAYLVWKGSDGKEVKSPLGADPRTWHSGYNSVVTMFTPTTAQGTLYLELSDPLLPDNPLYSIALANDQVFDKNTGYNKLFEVN